MEEALCYVNNRFVPYGNARLHVSDLALHRGFGIFDYFLEVGGKFHFLEDYLDRFYRSAEALGLEVPLDRSLLKEKVLYLIRENRFRNSGIKVLLTGGYSEDFFEPGIPNLVIINKPFTIPYNRLEKGVRLITYEHLRFRPEIKTINYLPSVMLLPELRKKEAIEVLFHWEGKVLETSRSNIFMVKGKKVVTPKDDILPGIIRRHVCGIVENGFILEERSIGLSELLQAEEVFITGTSKHITPVIRIDDTVIGAGLPGTVTKKLTREFQSKYF